MNTSTHENEGDTYTAFSFAPVQGFIEKSRKLRDLFGASLILSYLSQELAKAANASSDCEVISPALIDVQEGMPNRILIRGLFERNAVEQTLIKAWDKVLITCREWIEEQAFPHETFSWEHEWLKWKQYTWEIFWGHGKSPDEAMRDLERRKLKRDWTGVNWTGDSSSLTGTDAIAGLHLGKEDKNPGCALSSIEKESLIQFYRQLAWVLDDPYNRAGAIVPKDQEPEGKYIAANERLSLPELVKRLVTLPKLAKKIGMEDLGEGFKDIYREPGYWTGWFMGDGDKVGRKLKDIAAEHGKEGLKQFSEKMRSWGQTFQTNRNQFPEGKGRVIYAGGDDFLGVIYSDRPNKDQQEPPKVKPHEALDWLRKLPDQWSGLQVELKEAFETESCKFDQTYSVGFVWAGHSVPQRDILQHCREAEKLAKSLGRDRVTIRVVFNSGQYVQWTCPWNYLDILTKYCDRDRNGNQNPTRKQNWTHLYSDWAQLKARHGISLKETAEFVDERLALAIFDLYFNDLNRFEMYRCEIFKEKDTPQAIIQWIDGLINVGWQLCSNS
jgi:CRISPR-associated protein Cmr2